MKITKILRGLLIALSIMMVFALFACNDNEVETSDTSESISESESESVSDSASESESESGSETEKEPCKHTNTTLNDKCDKICSDCNATVKTGQHVAGNPDANDKCNVKCTNCGKVMKANQHTAGQPDANDNCNVKCTVCNEIVKEKQHTPGEPDANDNCNVKCTACNEVLKTAQHTQGDRKPDKNDECKIKCPVCSAQLSQKHGATSDTWTAIPGVAEDGKLYETKNCVDCGTARETRVVAKIGSLDTIKVGDVEVENKKEVGSSITLVESNNSGDTVIIAGWIGINGGVDKYVYRIIDAEGNTTAWINAAYDVAPQNMNATAHKEQISAITGAKLGISGYEANAIFTDGIKTGTLVSYLGQTITVEFAVIPANNKGTAEAPNTIVVASVANFKVVCDHEGNTNEYKVTAADPQWLVCESCSVCKTPNLKKPADKNLQGLLVFNPSNMVNGTNRILMTENGMSFVRINSTDPSAVEENMWLYKNQNGTLTNVGEYIAILCRSSVDNSMELFLDSTTTAISGSKQVGGITAGENWKLIIVKSSDISGSKFDGKNLVAFRLDHFNNGSNNRTTEDYVDIAFVSFFASQADAEAYYVAYLNKYIGIENCYHRYETDWAPVEVEEGGESDYKIQNHCVICNNDIVKICGHSFEEGTWVPANGETQYEIKSECLVCKDYVFKICEHSFNKDAWVPVNGETQYEIKNECLVCKEDVFKICGHSFDEDAWTPVNGETQYEIQNECLVCKTEHTKICEHSFDENAWTKGEEEGKKQNDCVVCLETINKDCEHSFDNTKWELIDEETGLVKNTCLVCESEVERICDHNIKHVNIAEDGTFRYICKDCKQYTSNASDNQSVLMPNVLAGITTTVGKGADADSFPNGIADILVLNDPNYNNLPYLRIRVNQTTTADEAYVFINFDPVQKNVGKYVSVIYRNNTVLANEMFITTGGKPVDGEQVTASWTKDAPKWSYTVFDFSAKTNWDNSTGVGTIRWDINHTVKPGHYIDVAYIGFFNSPEEAKAFYEAYNEMYDLDYMFKGRKDNLTIDGTAASGLASTSGNSATLEYDFTGKTLAKTDSITFQGWFLSSLGVESYTIRIIGENGETKDRTQSGGNRSDIYTAVGKNSPYNFGQECGNGSGFHSKIYLAGFEGQIVDVMVYANTKDGKVINFFNIYNVTVPGEAQ